MKVDNKPDRTYLSFLPVIFLLLTVGCSDQLSHTQKGIGYLTLSVQSEFARLILPVTSVNDFASYHLIIQRSGADVINRKFPASQLSNPIPLEAGSYDIELTAFMEYNGGEPGLPAARGTKKVDINEGVSETRTITLEPFPFDGNETGKFSWKIEFAASLVLDKADMSIIPLSSGGTVTPSPISVLGPPNPAYDYLMLVPGYYNVNLDMERNGSPLPLIWKQVLHVYQNMESRFEYLFTEEFFTIVNYKVTFVYNDETTLDGEETVLYGDPVDEPPEPNRTGYTFDGWYTAGNVLWNFDTPVTDHLTLYAKWIPNHGIDIEIDIDANKPVLSVRGSNLSEGAVIAIYKDVTGLSDPEPVTISNYGSFTPTPANVKWVVNGQELATGSTYTINSSTAPFNTAGTKILTVQWEISGVPYSTNVFVRVLENPPGADENNPFMIYTEAELRKVGTGTDGWGLDKNYRLAANIDLTIAGGGTGAAWTPIPAGFTGSFNGGGHTITGLSAIGSDYTGMFSIISNTGKVHNLGLINVSISGYGNFFGGIAGQNNGLIENCFVTGSVISTIPSYGHVGGIAGTSAVLGGGTIKNCYSTATISAAQSCGISDACTVQNSVALGLSVNGHYRVNRVGTNNYARDDMLLNNFMLTSGDGKDTVHGESVALGTALSAVFGSSGADFDPLIWDIPNGGKLSIGEALPKLKNMAQYPTLPGDPDDQLPGSGTDTDPYLVNQNNILRFNAYARGGGHSRNYKLIENVTLTSPWTPIGTFNGSFDGNGHAITGLSVIGSDYTGMFSIISNTGKVHNLGLINVSISGYGNFFGGIAGQNNGLIENCFVTGSVISTIPSYGHVGGIAGTSAVLGGGTIKNCYSTATISAAQSGGISDACTVQNSIALGLSVNGYFRIARETTAMTKNYARDDLLLNGSMVISGDSVNTVHGESVPLGTAQSDIFGPGGAQFDPAVWDFPGGNLNIQGNLPKLKNMTQYPVLPGDPADQLPGKGTEEDPYLVNQLNILRFNVYARGAGHSRHYKLIENVVLNSADNWIPIGTFNGSFDGNKYTITGLSASGSDNLGMFSIIGNSGRVDNLGLIDVTIYGSANFYGGIAGTNDGTIENCFVTGSVISTHFSYGHVGGIAGIRNASGVGLIINCYSTATVSGAQGGGITDSCTVQNSVALGTSINGGGRIFRGGTGSNNYARSDMLVGINPVTSDDSNSSHGADIGYTECSDVAWWRAQGFNPAAWPVSRLPLGAIPCTHNWGWTEAPAGTWTEACTICGVPKPSGQVITGLYKDDYYYIWGGDSNGRSVEINGTEYISSYPDDLGGGYIKLTINFIEPIINNDPSTMEDYPYGFRFNLTITENTSTQTAWGDIPSLPVGGGEGLEGNAYLYISTDKDKIVSAAGSLFIKQP